MKTFSKTSKAMIIAVVAIMLVASALVFVACNDNKDAITKYDATFEASITMGQMGSFSFADVFQNAYVESKDGKYTLTATFDKGELEVMGQKGIIFVDDNPEDSKNVGNIVNGTLGIYNASGELVTDGVKATYSTGDDYLANNAKVNRYYVKSVSFPIESLKEEYEITLYINSAMMGKQFSKDSGYRAYIKLDLNSGTKVDKIEGLGVATRGTVSTTGSGEVGSGEIGSGSVGSGDVGSGEMGSGEVGSGETGSGEVGSGEIGSGEAGSGEQIVAPVADKYTKYDATLNAAISMAGNNVDFAENLINGVYVIEKDGKYEITIAFKSGAVHMPFGNETVGYVSNEAYVPRGATDPVNPQLGYYKDTTLVTECVTFTYSTGANYVEVSGVKKYYVQTMTFTVDSLDANYTLAINVMTAMGSAQQFPYTASSGDICDAVLALDLTQATTVDTLDGVNGVSTLATIANPEAAKYTRYDASLNAVISMAGNNVDFAENLIEGVYIIMKEDKYEITIAFKSGAVHMPFGNETVGYVSNEAYVPRGATDPVNPQLGYYNDTTLVTEGVEFTYSTGDNYVEVSGTKHYYVKTMTFTVDSFDGVYTLALNVMTAMGSAQQFPYTASNGTVSNATLTLNLGNSSTLDDLESVWGVETLEEVAE